MSKFMFIVAVLLNLAIAVVFELERTEGVFSERDLSYAMGVVAIVAGVFFGVMVKEHHLSRLATGLLGIGAITIGGLFILQYTVVAMASMSWYYHGVLFFLFGLGALCSTRFSRRIKRRKEEAQDLN